MQKHFFVCLAMLLLQSSHAQFKLVKLWETDSTLKVPESVLFANNILYVSNIDGKEPWGKDGKGSIGKVGLDGKMLKVDWVTGLNAPKGMGIFKNRLYVADITEVVVIDISKASIIKRIVIDSAKALNDITIDRKGIVYVSDSRGKKVYQITNDQPSVLLDSLQRPNGLLIEKDELYLLDDGTMYKMEKNKKLTMIANGMEGGTDGLVYVGGGDFIVSCWAGAIWQVHKNGTKELLLNSQSEKMNTADMGYDAKKKIIYVPTFWKNSIVAFQLQ
jgi:sugar lactone lactonase YvrE